jgi:long-chain acyl-CoA synthetase
MLYSILKNNAQKSPEQVAFQIKRGETYVRYTYREMLELCVRFASHLQRNGVTQGDRVALWAENIPEWPLAYLAIHLAGATVVPLDVQYQDSAVTSLLSFAEVKVLLCSRESADKAAKVAAALNLRLFTIDNDNDARSLFHSPAAPGDFVPHEAAPDSLMSIIFTSGTTGEPKGVMLTCNNFVSNAQAITTSNWRLTAQDNFLCVLPLHHCYAFTGTFLTPFLLGATTTFQPVLKGPAIISAMQETGVTIMFGVPQLYNMFAQAIQDNIAKQPWWKRTMFKVLYRKARRTRLWFNWNLGKRLFGAIHQRFGKKFRFFVSGGAKLDTQVGEFFWNLGLPLVEGYGLTETAPVLCCSFYDRYYPGAIGPALPGIELKIANPDSQKVGEIIMRGPNLMKGYYKNDKATQEMIRDGWFYTGDLGYLDARGHIHITGRAKELIVLESGKKVYPEEVERHFLKSKMIAEVCLVGEKKPDGRIPALAALIVPNLEEAKRRKTHSLEADCKYDIEDLMRELPSYMRPNSWKLVAGPFPRTRLGKLKRSQIEQMNFAALDNRQQKDATCLSEEERQLLSKPASEKLLARLQKLTGYDKAILPGDSLELDLGVDSLKRMELLVILEQEFGLKLTGEQIAELRAVSDVLRILPAGETNTGQTAFSWHSLLAQKTTPELGELFNLRRGFVKNFIVDVVRWVARIILSLCFGVKLKNWKELKNINSATILAPTHQSYLDAVFIYAFLPSRVLHRTVFIAMDQMFGQWPWRWMVRPSRIIRTASSSTALSSLQYAAQALAQNMCVCIFPEGQRTSDGKVCQPMVGTGVLACERQAQVLPMLVEGAIGAYSRTQPGLHFCKVELSVLAPFPPPGKSEFGQSDYRAVADQWYNIVTTARKENEK